MNISAEISELQQYIQYQRKEKNTELQQKKTNKAKSTKQDYNCHITSLGKAYLVQDQISVVGEERVGKARATEQKKEKIQLGMGKGDQNNQTE